MTAVIYANNPSTNLPLGVPLATSAAVAQTGTGGAQTVSLTTFNFSSFLFVTGVTYWVGLEPGRDGTDVEWGTTTNTTDGSVAENLGSGYHAFTMGGFVPMPPSASVLYLNPRKLRC